MYRILEEERRQIYRIENPSTNPYPIPHSDDLPTIPCTSNPNISPSHDFITKIWLYISPTTIRPIIDPHTLQLKDAPLAQQYRQRVTLLGLPDTIQEGLKLKIAGFEEEFKIADYHHLLCPYSEASVVRLLATNFRGIDAVYLIFDVSTEVMFPPLI